MLKAPNYKVNFGITDRIVGELIGDLNTSTQETKLVGGAVRDALLNRHTKDLDFATTASPKDVVEVIKAHGLKPITVGIEFGTVGTHLPSGFNLEITQLRKDIDPDGRHTIIEATSNWREDAKRRDFTVNALYADLDGTIYDPLGTGLSDVNAGRVTFIGDPSKRIQEDYLRILRYFRFQSHFGLQPANTRDQKAIADNLDGLRKVSRERIKSELHRIFLGPYSAQTAELLLDSGVLPYLLNTASSCFEKMRIKRLDILMGVVRKIKPDITFEHPCFFALHVLIAKDYQDQLSEIIEENLNLSKSERHFLSHMRTCLKDFDNDPIDFSPLADGNLNKYVYQHGKSIVTQAQLIRWIDDTLLAPMDNDEALSLLLDIEKKNCPIRSADLLELFPDLEGKDLGARLRAAEDWWLSQNCVPDSQSCLAYLQNHYVS